MKKYFLYTLLCTLLMPACTTSPTTENPPAPIEPEGPQNEAVVLTNNPDTEFDDVGCPDADYPDWQTSPYVLPFPVGSAYPVDLSNCSGSFHGADQPDAFAVDFAMPIGTLITAARAGTVVFVEESGVDGQHPNNYVVVDHSDNTFALYAHLTQDGALVAVGDAVDQGDEIGLSGSTGYAGYPHLHFIVVIDSWDYPFTSIPITFRNTSANPRGLAAYTEYKALPFR